MPSIIDMPKPMPAEAIQKVDSMMGTFSNQCREMMTFAKQADFAQVQASN